MQEFLELQSTLKPGSEITEVKWKNNRLYFKVDGHQFTTIGNFVYHENNPFARSPIADIMARKHNTPEGIAEEEESNRKYDKAFHDFMEHRADLFAHIFSTSLTIYRQEGKEKFLEYVDTYLEIMSEDEGDKIIQHIKRTKGGS